MCHHERNKSLHGGTNYGKMAKELPSLFLIGSNLSLIFWQTFRTSQLHLDLLSRPSAPSRGRHVLQMCLTSSCLPPDSHQMLDANVQIATTGDVFEI